QPPPMLPSPRWGEGRKSTPHPPPPSPWGGGGKEGSQVPPQLPLVVLALAFPLLLRDVRAGLPPRQGPAAPTRALWLLRGLGRRRLGHCLRLQFGRDGGMLVRILGSLLAASLVAKVKLDRNVLERQLVAERVHQVALIGVVEQLRPVGEQHDRRRSAGHLSRE